MCVTMWEHLSGVFFSLNQNSEVLQALMYLNGRENQHICFIWVFEPALRGEFLFLAKEVLNLQGFFVGCNVRNLNRCGSLQRSWWVGGFGGFFCCFFLRIGRFVRAFHWVLLHAGQLPCRKCCWMRGGWSSLWAIVSSSSIEACLGCRILRVGEVIYHVSFQLINQFLFFFKIITGNRIQACTQIAGFVCLKCFAFHRPAHC